MKLPLIRSLVVAPSRAPVLRYGVAILSTVLALIPTLFFSDIAESRLVVFAVAVMVSAWLGGMISVLDPEIIVVGGGISQIGDPLFSRLRAITPTRSINQFAALTPIVPAMLASNVGVLGAASAALDLLGTALH